MRSKERIIATLKGEKTDRIPIWLRDEFNLSPRFDSYLPADRYRTIGSGLEYDDFTDAWIKRDTYRTAILDRDAKLQADRIVECKPPDLVCNRFLAIPPEYIVQQELRYEDEFRIEEYIIPTPKGDLDFTVKFQKDISTQWMTEEPVKDTEDLKKIMSIPFKLPDMDFKPYLTEKNALGEDGVTAIQIDTPLVAVSGLMRFEDYLMLTVTDQGLLRELCDIAYERISLILDRCLESGMGPIFRFNGSEQSTPPMNSPDIYERFIYSYEKRLIDKVHRHGGYAAVHCHGFVKQILPRMVDMKLDLLDPIEAPPSGNIEFGDAWKAVNKKITLAGNIQLRDLQNENEENIRRQVRALIDSTDGSHFILNTSASPLTWVTPKTRDNYIAMLDEWAEYGRRG